MKNAFIYMINIWLTLLINNDFLKTFSAEV